MIDLHAACACCPDDLKTLSDQELIALADAVSQTTGQTIVKVSERERAIEESAARDLLRDFRQTLDPALEDAIASLPLDDVDAADVNAALREVGRQIENRDVSRTLAILGGALSAIALLARRKIRRLVGRAPSGRVRVGADLNQPDVDALNALAQQQLFWIGDFWSSHLSRRITATVAREQLAVGLGRDQAGDILRGVIRGSVPGVRVPETFLGGDEDYFRMLSGTVRARASNFGAVFAMDEGGIESYRIEAVLDKRTSKICDFMHGRTFAVRQGRRHIDRTLRAGDPDAVREAAGWRSLTAAEQIAGAGDDASQSQALASAGMALPPYHGRCRTVVVPA